MRTLVPEYRAVDALLPAGVDEFPPDKQSVGISGSEDNLLSWPREQNTPATIAVAIAGVVPFI